MEIRVTNTISRLEGFSQKDLNKVKTALSTFAPGYRYTKLYKKRLWNGKVTLLKQNTFPTGLIPHIVKIYPKATLIDERQIKVPKLKSTCVELRPYQEEVIEKALKNTLYKTWWPRGVIKVATGGGKSQIAIAITEMTSVPTLFLVHRKDLLKQIVDRYAQYGIEVGSLGEDEDKQVIASTIQSLMSFNFKVNKTENRDIADVERISRSKEEKGKAIQDYLRKVEQVFIDEAHLLAATLDKGNSFTKALELMPNAYMRWGLTATPFMREEYHDWLLEGSTGQVLCEVSSKTLVDLGYLAIPNITMFKIKVKSLQDWKLDYETGIVGNEKRNEKIVNLVKSKPSPTMVLVQRVPHGNILNNMFEKAGLTSRFLYGNSPLNERVRALEDLKSGALDVVIGSTIWDEGLDVAEIRTLILAGGGKSKIKNLQRVGRGLRLSEGKNTVEIIDFFEEGSRWLRNHAVSRMRTWRDQGFDVNLVV